MVDDALVDAVIAAEALVVAGEDDLVVAGVPDHLRDDIVGGDGIFHFPEPQFKSEVAVHGETAGPYLSPVRLLPDAENGEMKQEQDNAE